MYLEMKEHNVSIFKQLRTNGVRCACVCVCAHTHIQIIMLTWQVQMKGREFTVLLLQFSHNVWNYVITTKRKKLSSVRMLHTESPKIHMNSQPTLTSISLFLCEIHCGTASWKGGPTCCTGRCRQKQKTGLPFLPRRGSRQRSPAGEDKHVCSNRGRMSPNSMLKDIYLRHPWSSLRTDLLNSVRAILNTRTRASTPTGKNPGDLQRGERCWI